MSIHPFPRTPLLRVIEQSPAGVHHFGERYELKTWIHGYAIYDRGDLICTFHGPQLDLAASTLKRLQDAEAEAKATLARMLEASVATIPTPEKAP